MSERERWIVYPLLFFALGSAIRDKILNYVESKHIVCAELEAGAIRCREIVVSDPDGRSAGLAKLGSTVARSADGTVRRVGLLVLTDSDGQEFFGLADDELSMRRLRCENLSVIDPRGGQTLASLGVHQVNDQGALKRVGALALTDSDGQEFFGLADDELSMRRLRCENLAIIDTQSGRTVASLGVGQVSARNDPTQQMRVGLLQLNGAVTPFLPGAQPLAPTGAGVVPQVAQPPAPAGDSDGAAPVTPEAADPPADEPDPAVADP